MTPETQERMERLKKLRDGGVYDLDDASKRIATLEEQIVELTAGIHGYIADVHTAKNACAELIKIQGEQAWLLSAKDAQIEHLEAEVKKWKLACCDREDDVIKSEEEVERLTKEIANHRKGIK